MNQTLRTTLIITGALVGAAVLVLAGITIGQASQARAGFWPLGANLANPVGAAYGCDPRGFVGPLGPGMQGYNTPYDPDNDGACPGYGTMGGYGMMGPDMMGGTQSSGLLNVEPLSLDEARAAVENYLEQLGTPDLAVGEVMAFDNHAYAQIVEQGTGMGAMEVLIDPATRQVYPEHGPNMMWNLKYSPMGEFGMMGMMGGRRPTPPAGRGGMMGTQPPAELTAEMVVTPEQAVQVAQDYLDAYLPGTEADEHADPFYGYYTLHVLRDGEVVGMLSVNGYSAQVFLHTWHGDFVEMSEADHD